MTDGVFDINSGINITDPASEADILSLNDAIKGLAAALEAITYN
jgi:hypothetical protein